MKTVSADLNTSLIYWKQTCNKYELGYSKAAELKIDLDRYFIESYADVFKEIENKLIASKKVSFVKLWKDVLNSKLSKLRKKISTDFAPVNIESENVDKMINKFRGNCGEILIEKLVEVGYFSKYFKNYIPIDPNHEDYTDASADELNGKGKIGIQIKNFNTTKIERTIIEKAAIMDSIWIRNKKASLDYISQIIISFTDRDDDYKIADLKNCHIFIGPKEIDNFDLTGKLFEQNGSNHNLFKELYTEIEEFI